MGHDQYSVGRAVDPAPSMTVWALKRRFRRLFCILWTGSLVHGKGIDYNEAVQRGLPGGGASKEAIGRRASAKDENKEIVYAVH